MAPVGVRIIIRRTGIYPIWGWLTSLPKRGADLAVRVGALRNTKAPLRKNRYLFLRESLGSYR